MNPVRGFCVAYEFTRAREAVDASGQDMGGVRAKLEELDAKGNDRATETFTVDADMKKLAAAGPAHLLIQTWVSHEMFQTRALEEHEAIAVQARHAAPCTSFFFSYL